MPRSRCFARSRSSRSFPCSSCGWASGSYPRSRSISLATTFPMYINTSAAMRNVDRKVVEAARSYGLHGIRLVREVIFPLSLPGLLTGLRFSLSLSVLALVGAETIASNGGIGYLINQAEQFQADQHRVLRRHHLCRARTERRPASCA